MLDKAQEFCNTFLTYLGRKVSFIGFFSSHKLAAKNGGNLGSARAGLTTLRDQQHGQDCSRLHRGRGRLGRLHTRQSAIGERKAFGAAARAGGPGGGLWKKSPWAWASCWSTTAGYGASIPNRREATMANRWSGSADAASAAPERLTACCSCAGTRRCTTNWPPTDVWAGATPSACLISANWKTADSAPRKSARGGPIGVALVDPDPSSDAFLAGFREMGIPRRRGL